MLTFNNIYLWNVFHILSPTEWKNKLMCEKILGSWIQHSCEKISKRTNNMQHAIPLYYLMLFDEL